MFEQQRRSQQQRQHSGDSEAFRGGGEGEDFSSFFESMFGESGWQGRRTRFRGSDYQAELHLELADIMKTHKRTLTVNGKNIRITIPAGVENGQVIKIKGHGAPGPNGGPAGDLYITFQVADTAPFRRSGFDLHTKAAVDLYTAILGGDVLVDTLDGKVKLKVNPETQPGTTVRLKGKGVPVYKKEGEYGDLYVTYDVSLPKNLSDEQRELFRKLSRLQ
jgi:curved DNA-binding protein